MKYIRYVVVLCVVLLAVYAGVSYYGQVSNPNVNAHLPMQTITIGRDSIRVEVATTDEQRKQGLSGRTSLATGSGMLFVFDPAKPVAFWMKDMKFSLDMIFARDDGVIVKIYSDVSPETYPKLFPSGEAVRYVLEVPAGYAEASAIATGQKIVVE